jgi:hypothetical protein
VAVNGAHATLVAGPSRVLSKPVVLYAWSPDGHWLLIQSDSGLIRIPAAGGRSRVLMHTPPRAYLAAAAWSPDGSAIIVAVSPVVPGVAPVRFYRFPVTGGRLTPVDFPLMRYVSSLAWQRGS